MKEFWSKLWNSLVPYKKDPEWLKEVELELEAFNIQDNVEIIQEDVTMQLRKMPNWKTPGLDGIQRIWLKRFTSQHQSLSIRSWLVKNRTAVIQKDPEKCNAVANYGPKACLNLLWKLKTGIFADKLYQHPENDDVLLEEHNGCRHVSSGTKDHLLIDKAVIRNCKRRKANQNIA